MWKLLNTRISVLQFGTLVVKTRSDLCGDITSRIRKVCVWGGGGGGNMCVKDFTYFDNYFQV